MIEVRGMRGFRGPARILQRLVNDSRGPVEAIVSYGMPIYSPSVPVLNANAGKVNKYHQGTKIAASGVPVVRHLTPDEARLWTGSYPVIGRSASHAGGTDIMLAQDRNDVRDRIMAGAEFFTVYEPSLREIRVWVYRRRHLATYLKVLARPREYRGFGRNYDNGWGMELVSSSWVPRDAVGIAAGAVEALDLDFGAVDILKTPDGRFVVLEVNTAPGIEDEGRFSALQLARKIKRWRELEFPERRGA